MSPAQNVLIALGVYIFTDLGFFGCLLLYLVLNGMR